MEKEKTQSKRKKNVSEALQKVAHKLHNTASVCRSNYIDPYLIETYMNHSKKFFSIFERTKTKEEITDGYLTLLRSK